MKNIPGTTAFIFITALALGSCKKLSKEEKISVYPNPAMSYIVFDASGSSKFKNGEITVKDMTGTVIKVFKTADSSHVTWDVNNLSRGVYNYWYTADKMPTQTGKMQLN